MQKARAKALEIRLPPEDDLEEKADDFYTQRMESIEEKEKKRGWHEGLKHLHSSNFQDFMDM